MRVRRTKKLRWWKAACASMLVLVFTSCGLLREEEAVMTPVPDAPNLLTNGSFEEGIVPWIGPFFPQTTTITAHGGASSLELPAGSSATQTVLTGELPEFVSGFYKVDEWPPHDTSAYLEVVVTIRQLDPAANREVHLVIGGIDVEPPPFPAGSFVFLSRAAPDVGTWTYFGYPLHDALNATGGGPTSWVSIDVGVALSGEGGAAVAYYDDVYFGTQVGNPNRPATPN